MQEEYAQDSRSIRMQWKKLNTEQKLAIIALIVGAGFAFVFAALRVRNGIYSPFLVSVSEYRENRELIKDPITEYENLQKRTDTDGDGLSDWSEENVYKTSPYLWSTAGDEIPDNVKIARGENPLCKSGEDCSIGSMNFDLATSSSPFSLTEGRDLNQFDDILLGNSPSAQAFQETALEAGLDFEALKSEIPKDPAVLREAALKSGKVTQEQLDKISDEELVKLFTEAIEELEKEEQTSQINYE